MRTALLSLTLLLGGLALLAAPATAQAQLTPEQRKTLSDLRTDLTKAATLLRKKDTAEAGKLIAEIEEKLNKLVEESELDDNDRTVTILRKTLEARKESLAELGGTAPAPTGNNPANPAMAGTSFTNHVAPIIASRCLGCHTNNPGGGLNLSTFAGMVQGGRGGRLVTAGNAPQSLLIQRLTTNGPGKMPRNGTPLTDTEIETISKWITEGAKFDGNSQTAALNTLTVPGAPANPMPKPVTGPVTINKPTGSETVSFTKDIAPFMVNICLNCHSGNNPRSGFSLETFEKLMTGGSSGRVVVPGDLDGSRLWDLVGKQRPLKMPPGNQLLITRTNWNALQTWIKEGARFDGPDPKAPIRSLVPTEAEIRAGELAKLTPEEWAQMRMKNSEDTWKRVMSGEQFRKVESGEFFVYGNVAEARLQQVNDWAAEQLATIQKTFGDKSAASPVWKGKLTIYVIKDRFGYEEFNLTLMNRQTPKNMFGHVDVSPTFEQAYLVVQDVGDTVKADSPGLEVNLLDKLTEAYFARGDASKLPSWMREGAGLALAWDKNRESEYLGDQEAVAWENITTMDASKPEAIFAVGTFSPAGTKAVGYTLSRFLLSRGGAPNYKKLVEALQSGQTMDAAINSVYRSDLATMARLYASSLKKPASR